MLFVTYNSSATPHTPHKGEKIKTHGTELSQNNHLQTDLKVICDFFLISNKKLGKGVFLLEWVRSK